MNFRCEDEGWSLRHRHSCWSGLGLCWALWRASNIPRTLLLLISTAWSRRRKSLQPHWAWQWIRHDERCSNSLSTTQKLFGSQMCGFLQSNNTINLSPTSIMGAMTHYKLMFLWKCSEMGEAEARFHFCQACNAERHVRSLGGQKRLRWATGDREAGVNERLPDPFLRRRVSPICLDV